MKRLKKLLSYIIYSVLAVVMASCNHLEEGVVVSKRYEEATQHLMLIPVTVGKTTIIQQYWVYDSEDWVIKIKGVHEGEIEYESVYVTRECYEALEKGNLWIKTESCSYSDDNNTKERYE
mgnify:CR=1 FL=1|tara:strand:+ start:429 stop:788 length:360 start_codon:yes stop_codon:yes gene_type:complete